MKTTQFGSLHPLRSLVDAQADSVQVARVILPVAPQGQGKDIEPEIVKAAVAWNVALRRRVLFPVCECSDGSRYS